jgi:hypothetical protein
MTYIIIVMELMYILQVLIIFLIILYLLSTNYEKHPDNEIDNTLPEYRIDLPPNYDIVYPPPGYHDRV